MPQQELDFRRVPGKLHRQIKNLAKNKVGININSFVVEELKAFLVRCPETPLRSGDTNCNKRILVTGVPERLYKDVQARVMNRYGLKMDRFMVALLIAILERYPEHDKEKQSL